MNAGDTFLVLHPRTIRFPPVIEDMKPGVVGTCDPASSSHHPGPDFCQRVRLRNVRYADPLLFQWRHTDVLRDEWTNAWKSFNDENSGGLRCNQAESGSFWRRSLLCNLPQVGAGGGMKPRVRKRQDSNQTRRSPLIHS